MLLPICRWIFTLICLRSEPDFTVLLHSCAPFVFLPPNGPGFFVIQTVVVGSDGDGDGGGGGLVTFQFFCSTSLFIFLP